MHAHFRIRKRGGKENKDGIILLSLMKLNYVTKHGSEKFFFYEGYYIFFNEQRSLRNDFYAINWNGIDWKEGEPVVVIYNGARKL